MPPPSGSGLTSKSPAFAQLLMLAEEGSTSSHGTLHSVDQRVRNKNRRGLREAQGGSWDEHEARDTCEGRGGPPGGGTLLQGAVRFMG